MAPLKFFGKLSTANKSERDVTFYTANNSIRFTIEKGVTANIGVDDSSKADSIINVRFGRDATEVFSLTTDSSWPAEVESAELTWEGGFLTIRAKSGAAGRKAVFNKKGAAV